MEINNGIRLKVMINKQQSISRLRRSINAFLLFFLSFPLKKLGEFSISNDVAKTH